MQPNIMLSYRVWNIVSIIPLSDGAKIYVAQRIRGSIATTMSATLMTFLRVRKAKAGGQSK